MRVGFVGSGSMAAALARGLAAHGGAHALLFSDAGSGRAAALAEELGGEVADGSSEIGARSEAVVLAVKPKALEAAADGLEGFRGPLISLLGATPLSVLERAFPAAALVRAMPNVAVEVGRGTICHAPAPDPATAAAVRDLLEPVATLVEVPEELIDPATAVMGCSGAYLALACEAIAEAGADAGLDPELSERLVGLTAAGTGELLLRHDPASLQRAIASPGGSTEAGLEALAEHRADEAFKAAVSASLERMAGTR